MTKTYLLEEAKELVKNGTHQVHNDCNNLELLKDVLNNDLLSGLNVYYIRNNESRNSIFPNLEIIPLSSIQDIKWGDEVQGSDNAKDWTDNIVWKFCGKNPVKDDYLVVSPFGNSHRFSYVRKPEPDLKSLQEKLQSQLDQELKGYTVVIQKES